jgi:glycosyltransferase involved in cell wall biosynthesis
MVIGPHLWTIPASELSAVFVQYYPNAFFGSKGRAMRRWLRTMRSAGVPVITTMHELWPPASRSLRRTGARFLMRRLAKGLIATSSQVVCTQERSIGDLTRAGLVTPFQISLIPVGSNIDRVEGPALPPQSTYTLIMFGQPAALHGPTLVALAGWLHQRDGAVTLRWLNRSVSEARQMWVDGLRLPTTHIEFFGGLGIREASALLASGDLAIAPYVDGVSTRRSTLVAQLQHGRPIVGTVGPSTGALLRRQTAMALRPVGAAREFVDVVDQLLGEPDTRAAMALAATSLFDAEFSWPTIADAYLGVLDRRYGLGAVVKQ